MVVVLAMLSVLSLMATIDVPDVFAAKKRGTLPEPTVSAGSAIVMSASTGQVVYALHEDRKLSTGTTAQLMTAMVVIDRMHDEKEFGNKVQITEEMAAPGGALAAGESVSVEDLMYAMLMTSDPGAALSLAIYSSGSESAFVEQMNAKAQQLGFEHTKYTNATGAYDAEQYSTVEDTAGITKAAFRYARIKGMCGTAKREIDLGKEAGKKALETTNGLLAGSGAYQGCYGGNTGALSEPEGASVYTCGAVRDDMDLIVVLLEEEEGKRLSEAAALFDYGFDHVKRQVIIKGDKMVGRVKVRCGEKTRVPAYTAGKGFVYIPAEGSDSLVKTESVIYDNVEAPLKKGAKVGEYRIYVAEELTGTVDLVVREDIGKGWFPSYLYISNMMTVILLLVLLVLWIAIMRLRAERRRRRRQRERRRKEKIRELARQQKEIEDDRRRRNWTYR